MKPPIDLTAAWDAHVASVLEDRDPQRISASDLHGCDRAFWDRYHGGEQLAYGNASFSAFERGHAYETRVFEAFRTQAEREGLSLARGGTIDHDGIEGHPDLLLWRATGDSGIEILATIDPTTTASKFSDWSYGHALKSAFYSYHYGAAMFCEFVICIGFGGNILKVEPHWFHLDDVPELHDDLAGATWRERVIAAMARSRAVAASEVQPVAEPPIDPLDGTRETWRCGKPGSGKSYCRNARCPLNAQADIPLIAQAR